MDVTAEISNYLNSLSPKKRGEMETLHNRICQMMPQCKLWFLSGKDDHGRTISNPSIGYGEQVLKYASQKSRDFYQIGISSNSAGISVYVMGLDDQTYLPNKYAPLLSKAKVTSYCIRFKTLQEIDLDILEQSIMDGRHTNN